MGQMVIIRVDGTEETTEVDHVTLEDVQSAVGGDIQAVPYFDHWKREQCQVWCDEEGKLKGYEHNSRATQHWNENLRHRHGIEENSDHLVGDIVILTGSAMLN